MLSLPSNQPASSANTPLPPFERPAPPPRTQAASPPVSIHPLHLFLGFLANPSAGLQQAAERVHPLIALSLPGATFTLFMLQIGLDRLRGGTAGAPTLIALTFAGMLFGTLGIAMVAVCAWALLKLFGISARLGAVLRLCALSYSPTLIYVTLGLMANILLGWYTAVTFGVTGVLWSLGPLSSVLRQMTGNRIGVSLLITTVSGLLVLIGWGVLGNML